uniref:Uncharacterized protein n=1 Tax=Caenorhabditis japonica TaxID=281687 RepID=A0A8R1E631_CAEJA
MFLPCYSGGKVGLRMNTNKTTVMRNIFASKSPVNIAHNNTTTMSTSTSVGYSTITTNWSRNFTEDAEQHGLRSTTSRTANCFRSRL